MQTRSRSPARTEKAASPPKPTTSPLNKRGSKPTVEKESTTAVKEEKSPVSQELQEFESKIQEVLLEGTTTKEREAGKGEEKKVEA